MPHHSVHMPVNPGVQNADLQAQGNVQGANGQPRPGLPPELQNARPAGPGRLARIGAFLFGLGGAAGAGTAVGLNAGTIVAGTAMSVAGAMLGGTAVVTGLITGGAALLGGAIGVGIFAGIRAIARLFRRGQDPASRLQGQQNNLPQAQPAADVFNNSVADVILNGRGVLPTSLQQAADNTVSRLRDIYGGDLVPQDASLAKLLSVCTHSCSGEIRRLGGAVSPEQMSQILEKHMRTAMAYTAIEKAFEQYCGQDEFAPVKLRIALAERNPELLDNLAKANSQEEAQNILRNAEGEIRNIAQLYTRMGELHLLESTKAKMISVIAQSLGVDADAAAPHVDTLKCEAQVEKLKDNILRGKVNAGDIEQQFARLAESMAKPYVDSFAEVDKCFSEEGSKAMKMEILTSREVPDPELYKKGFAVGSGIDASGLTSAINSGADKGMMFAFLTMLGRQVNALLKEEYGPAAWERFVQENPVGLRIMQGAAFMAMVDKVQGLREALGGRLDLNTLDERFRMMDDRMLTKEDKAGFDVAYSGLPRVFQSQEFSGNFTDMKVKTQILDPIKNAGIPQDLKARWSEKAMNGEISSPAMARALIENVPGLPDETRPIMERFILQQSYAPGKAEASAQKAREFAREIAGWRNFNSAEEPGMAPLTDMIRQNIDDNLVGNQVYDRGISDQMKLDAHRSVFNINGEVLSHSDAEEVSQALRRAMPSMEATKMVSSIINQRAFVPLNGLGMQLNPATGEPLPENIVAGMGKMATRNIAKGILHQDLSASGQGNIEYTVTVAKGRAHITLSEDVGLLSGLGSEANGFPKLAGKARFTLHIDCDLLGRDGKSPSIQGLQLEQQLLAE